MSKFNTLTAFFAMNSTASAQKLKDAKSLDANLSNKITSAAMMFCIFLFGSANISAQWLQIGSLPELEWFANEVNNGNSFAGYVVELTADIGDPQNPFTKMIGNDTYFFEGAFEGNNHRIFVDIISDNTYVGLFSQYGGSFISDLLLDGSVVGGANSRNIGSLAGLVTGGDIHFITNLASVTGTGSQSIGGIAGRAENPNHSSSILFAFCTNNGFLSSGQDIGGLIGSTFSYNISIVNCYNAGTLSNATRSIAGLVGYATGSNHTILQNVVNIGQILL